MNTDENTKSNFLRLTVDLLISPLDQKGFLDRFLILLDRQQHLLYSLKRLGRTFCSVCSCEVAPHWSKIGVQFTALIVHQSMKCKNHSQKSD